jgi:lysophospholipase L1-like esterase
MSDATAEHPVSGSDNLRHASLSTAKRVLFGVLLLAGVIGLAEAGAALIYYLRLSSQEQEAIELAIGLRTAPTNTVLRFVSHPYFNYVANPAFIYDNGYQPHNALGFRGTSCCDPKKPGHVRIVAIGGSTTYGLNFTYEKNVWPALLQEKLQRKYGDRIEVINAGIPNYTTYELIGFTAMVLPELAPDVVLIHTGLNDAFTVGYPDEGGLDNHYFRHAWNYVPLSYGLRGSMRASYLVRLLGAYWGSSSGFSTGDMAEAIQYPVPDETEMIRNTETASGKYFRRNLQTLVALCRNMNALPVFMSEPLNPAREEDQNPYYRAVVTAVSRNNSIMRDVAVKNRASSIDLYATMREPAYFTDAAHETKAGMEKKADVVAEGLAAEINLLLSTARNK